MRTITLLFTLSTIAFATAAHAQQATSAEERLERREAIRERLLDRKDSLQDRVADHKDAIQEKAAEVHENRQTIREERRSQAIDTQNERQATREERRTNRVLNRQNLRNSD